MATLNMAFHTEDDHDRVVENRHRFFSHFDHEWENVVSSVQVHGHDYRVVDHKNRGEGTKPSSAKYECDALITEEPGLPITAYSADCMLIYFLIMDQPLVALVHAGWRGTLGGIGTRVVNYFKQKKQVDAARILAVFSPSICKKCYTVDDAVAEQFRSAGYREKIYLEQLAPNRWQLDLSAVNYSQLAAAGLKVGNIERDNFCTSCNPDLFYSYRRDQGVTGRMLGFIALKREPGEI